LTEYRTVNELNVRVECYAGYRGDETPQRFFIGARVVGVEEVIDRWVEPEQRYFKLRGDDGGVYILRHDMEAGSWDLHAFDSGRRAETRLSCS